MHEGTYDPQLMVQRREKSLNNNSSIITTRGIKCRHQLSRVTKRRDDSAVEVRDRNTCWSFKTLFNKPFLVISRKNCFLNRPRVQLITVPSVHLATIHTTIPMSLSYCYREVSQSWIWTNVVGFVKNKTRQKKLMIQSSRFLDTVSFSSYSLHTLTDFKLLRLR